MIKKKSLSETLTIYTLFYGEYEYLNRWLNVATSTSAEQIIVCTEDKRGYTDLCAYISDLGYRGVRVEHMPQSCNKYSTEWKQSDIRNAAVALCSTDWVLQMDIDEIIPVRFIERAQYHMAKKSSTAYAIPTVHIWHNQEVRVDGALWFPDWHYRLFKKDHRYTDGNRHLTLCGVKEIRGMRELVDYDYSIVDDAVFINHLKYSEEPVMCNGVYRCGKHDYKSIEEYNASARTVTMQEVLLRFNKGV